MNNFITRQTLIIPPRAKNLIHQKRSLTIKNRKLLKDVMQLAMLYNIAFPAQSIEIEINSIKSIAESATLFFIMVEENHFPLEPVWEWDGEYASYHETVKPWLTNIPVKVIGLEYCIYPKDMSEPQALLIRLALVGNYSKQAQQHKQMLYFDYPEWKWDGLLNTFRLNRVIPTLEKIILPPPFDMLPALVKYITGESETYFLDYTIESWPHYIQWNKKNFDWLKKDWEVALRIKNQADELTDWLIKNPDQLQKIWTILKIAHHRSLNS